MHPSSITGNKMGAKLERCTSYFFLSNNFSKRVKYCVMETECNPDEECEIYQAYYDPRMYGFGMPGYGYWGAAEMDAMSQINAQNTANQTQMEKKVDNQLIIGLVVGAVLFLLLSIIFVFKKKIKLRIMGKSKGNLNSKIYSNLVSRIISGPDEVESSVENQTVTISTISTNQTVTITRPLPSVPNRNHEKDCFFFINYETYVNKH